MTNMRDGMGFEEVNQEVTSTEIISGTTIYGGSFVTTPIGNITSVLCTTASGTNIYAKTAIEGATVTNADGTLKSALIETGTAAFGASIKAGSSTLAAGSNLWITFTTAFTGTPVVTATDMTTAAQALFIPVGSLNAGSFYVEGVTASDAFSWIAVGI